MGVINNAASKPLFAKAGTVPDVSGALQDYYQSMVFNLITKTVVGGQVVEIQNPLNFRGVIQPFTGRQLLLKPEGQRAWNWFLMNSDPGLTLKADDIVIWNNRPTRVMAKKSFYLYGFDEYHLVQDWTETP